MDRTATRAAWSLVPYTAEAHAGRHPMAGASVNAAIVRDVAEIESQSVEMTLNKDYAAKNHKSGCRTMH